MFTLLGWEWTYEPIDLDGYIPDFVLHLAKPLLVEVKPELDMAGLWRAAEVLNGRLGERDTKIMLVGCAPFPYTIELERQGRSPIHSTIGSSIGLARRAPGHWREVELVKGDTCGRYLPGLEAGHRCAADDQCATGLEFADAAWREAGNRVQWRRA